VRDSICEPCGALLRTAGRSRCKTAHRASSLAERQQSVNGARRSANCRDTFSLFWGIRFFFTPHAAGGGHNLNFVQGSYSRHVSSAEATAAGATRVVLVEEEVLLAESLTQALAAQGFAVTSVRPPAGATDRSAFAESILAVRPRVVVLDLDLSSVEDGMKLVTLLSRDDRVVVVMTSAEDPTHCGHALARGAQAVLPKSAGLTRVLETLRGAVAGEQLTGDGERRELIEHWRQSRLREDGHQARLDLLTPRESQVLAQLASGKRVSDIARDSQVSRTTVRTQVRSILTKLKVNSQIAAVALVRDLGWSPPRLVNNHVPPDGSVGAGS
jgi:two-component system, NarL family, nitrate/nitrite response regulator NarL